MSSAATAAVRRGLVLSRILNGGGANGLPRAMSSSSSSSSRGLRMAIDKPVSRMDEEVIIRVSGLAPNAHFTLHTGLYCPMERLNFASSSQFTSSADGCIDLETAAALNNGSGCGYIGVDPMGPLWSMRPEETSKPALTTLDVSTQLEFIARLYKGHGEIWPDTDTPLAACSFSRYSY